MFKELTVGKADGKDFIKEFEPIWFSDFFEPVLFTPDAIEKIIELLNYDKKNEFGKVQFVLLDGIGKSVINQIIDKSLIYKAFEDYYQ